MPSQHGVGNQSTERRVDWGTPRWLFDALHGEFDFTVDACADARNHKLDRYWSEADNGLAQSWERERVWCNPPYGKQIGPWVRKAAETTHLGPAMAAVLVPVRTELRWWHDWILHQPCEIRFLEGRVHFDPPYDLPSALGSRPVFASAVVLYGVPVPSLHAPVVRTMRTPRIQLLRSQLELQMGGVDARSCRGSGA